MYNNKGLRTTGSTSLPHRLRRLVGSRFYRPETVASIDQSHRRLCNHTDASVQLEHEERHCRLRLKIHLLPVQVLYSFPAFPLISQCRFLSLFSHPYSVIFPHRAFQFVKMYQTQIIPQQSMQQPGIANPGAPLPPQVPAGWAAHWDQSQQKFYFRNSMTGMVTWDYRESLSPIFGS